MKKLISVIFVSVLLVIYSLPVSAYDLNNAHYTDEQFIDSVLSYHSSDLPNNYFMFLAFYSGQPRYYVGFFYFDDSVVDPGAVHFTDNISFTTDSSFAWYSHEFKTYNNKNDVRFCGGPYTSFSGAYREAWGSGFRLLCSTVPVYDTTGALIGGEVPYVSPVSVDVSLNKSLDFNYYLNGNAVLPSQGEYIYIEIYDRAPAVAEFLWKPYRYVNIVSGVTKISEYLIVTDSQPKTYYITYDTLSKYCVADHPYEARVSIIPGYANYLNGSVTGPPSQPVEIASFEFRLSEDGFYKIITNVADRGPVKVTDEDGDGKDDYIDLNTGEKIDPAEIVYTFNSDVNADVPGSGVDVADFDFNVNFDTDLTQGAGLVRTLFDKFINAAGLNGYVICVLAIAVVGWFIFGSRR